MQEAYHKPCDPSFKVPGIILGSIKIKKTEFE